VKNLHHRLREAWHERIFILKAVSFASVGAVNAVVDFAVFWVAVQQFGVPLIPANVMSWLVAVSNSYVLNSFITFARESNRKLGLAAYLKFLGAGLAGLAINTTVLVTAVELTPHLIADPVLQLAAAKAFAILAAFVVNFSLSYYVVFRKRSDAPGT
jgi:putative flippase GtrA